MVRFRYHGQEVEIGGPRVMPDAIAADVGRRAPIADPEFDDRNTPFPRLPIKDRRLYQYMPLVNRIKKYDLSGESNAMLSARTARLKQEIAQGKKNKDDILVEAYANIYELMTRFRQEGKQWNVLGQQFTWNMKPYDSQLLAAISMSKGNIIDMKTGEGKTLVGAMDAYYKALHGQAQVATVTEYLSERDHDMLAPIFQGLGLTVGLNKKSMLTPAEDALPDQEKFFTQLFRKQQAYDNDVLFSPFYQLAHDYNNDTIARVEAMQDGVVPDNPAGRLNKLSRKKFLILDEIDEIAIDEANIPVLLSAGKEQIEEAEYDTVENIVSLFDKGEINFNVMRYWEKYLDAGLNEVVDVFNIDKNSVKYVWRKKKYIEELETRSDIVYIEEGARKTLRLTEQGETNLEQALVNEGLLTQEVIDVMERKENAEDTNLTPEEEEMAHRYVDLYQKAINAIKAHYLFREDEHYRVVGDRVVLLDTMTGRDKPESRYNEGMQQAIEARVRRSGRNVNITPRSETVAKTTVQDYVMSQYTDFSGMSGTALGAAQEFHKIYKKAVYAIPTNKECIRQEMEDRIFHNPALRSYTAVEDALDMILTGRPVLLTVLDERKLQNVIDEIEDFIATDPDYADVDYQVLRNEATYTDDENENDLIKQEAELIANAGRVRPNGHGMLTVAANMAGRGVDIKLDDDARINGGLHQINIERHKIRRVDQQKEGRVGRQGDPGSKQFYISEWDEVLRSGSVFSIFKNTLSDIIKSIQAKNEAKGMSNRKQNLEYRQDIRAHEIEYVAMRRELLSNVPKLQERHLDELFNFAIKDAHERYDEHRKAGTLNEFIYELKKQGLFVSGKVRRADDPEGAKKEISDLCNNLWSDGKRNTGFVNEMIHLAFNGPESRMPNINTLWKEHVQDTDSGSNLLSSMRGLKKEEYIKECHNHYLQFKKRMARTLFGNVFKTMFRHSA
jgi:preprotein translocase subunit SecA